MPRLPGEGIREICESKQAPGVVLRESHAAHDSWSHRGTWGYVRSGESGALAETRRRLEAGKFKQGRQRTLALTYARGYEMARKSGVEHDGIEDNLRRVCAASDETVEHVGPGGRFVKRDAGTRKYKDKRGRTVIERRKIVDVK